MSRHAPTATVPYITAWSSEQRLNALVIAHPRVGIGYPDETVADRDAHGVLWTRTDCRPGQGRPEFGRVHPLRQRRAMRKLLCQICAAPADRTDQGVLWLLGDDRTDWPGWPERMAATHPPVCLPCARVAVRACPFLRRNYVAVRVRDSRIAGVHGVRYRPGWPFPEVADGGDGILLPYDHPDIPWVRAAQLIRELRGCTIVDLDTETLERTSHARR
ncbi:hypothetical protein [Streptomyces sp. URMC 129]|uniref:hypothetical protein n=1 Tax=Streptomyces sp. URMC 129 TaxID=3423407 RepID=UPI003F19AFF6